MIIENRITGERFTIDPLQNRLNRHRRIIKKYCEVINLQNIENIMITLTYRDASAYGKRDITQFIQRLKYKYGKKILAYTWVAEMQKRGYEAGGLHYHVIVAVKKGTRIGMPDKNGLWSKGMTKVEKARTVFYVLKYAGKEYQKIGLPKGYRMYAVWIGKLMNLTNKEKWHLKKARLPYWVIKIIEVRDEWNSEGVSIERNRGGGFWIDGMLFECPFWLIAF